MKEFNPFEVLAERMFRAFRDYYFLKECPNSPTTISGKERNAFVDDEVRRELFAVMLDYTLLVKTQQLESSE